MPVSAKWDARWRRSTTRFAYTNSGVESFRATSAIDVIVTDIDTPSLRKLLDYLGTIDKQARELDISTSSTPPSSFPKGPRVVFLGADGKIKIKGSSGASDQTVDIYHDTLTKVSALQINTFAGPEVVSPVIEYIRRHDPIRGPPRSGVVSGQYGIPPPERITIVAIGNVSSIDVGGAKDQSNQDVYIETNISKETTVTEAAKLTETIRVAEYAHTKAVEASARRSSGGGSSGGGSSGGGGSYERPRERPSYERPAYRPPPRR